jgi:hypothetical protein
MGSWAIQLVEGKNETLNSRPSVLCHLVLCRGKKGAVSVAAAATPRHPRSCYQLRARPALDCSTRRRWTATALRCAASMRQHLKRQQGRPVTNQAEQRAGLRFSYSGFRALSCGYLLRAPLIETCPILTALC